MSILRALAEEHGYTAGTPWGDYESNYTIDVLADAGATQGFIQTFFADAPTEEQKTTAKNAIAKALDILDARWADGRKYAAGDKITAGDFQLLAIDIGLMNNAGGAKCKELSAEILEVRNAHKNVVRILDQVRGENGLDEWIKSLPPASL